MSLIDLINESRLLGPKKLAFRVGWELTNRTGLRALAEPTGPYPEPTGPETAHRQWFERLRQEHPLRLVRNLVASGSAGALIHQAYGDEGVDAIVARADSVEAGRFQFFRAFEAVAGTPPNWHLEPRRRRSWPRNAHWSTLLSHEDRNGDIKLTWELNRFVHVYDLIRAFAIDADESRVETFVTHLRSWEESNRYRAGVNWASGQELAIRVLSWTYGVAGLGGSDAFTEADFQRYRRLCYAHGRHIFENLGFARNAVPNNHLLAEALGLYVVGSLFDFDESPMWRGVAVDLFDRLVDQFDADGGYCQNSHTYARFALQMWLEVLRWRPDRRYSVLPVLGRASRLIRTFTSSGGRVPNWGFNDGSVLNVWCESDYQDFRPTLDAVDHACGRPGAASQGSREALLWLFGAEPTAERLDERSTRADFDATGLYFRQEGEARVAVRAGPMHQRTGHADQMHVDVWFGDREVACDAGSYSYHYDQNFHRWASGLSSHNIVTVDGLRPMNLLRKFKWQGVNPAVVSDSGESSMALHWPAYTAAGVDWRRRVSLSDSTVTVSDSVEIADQKPRQIRLHWLLAGVGWERRAGSLWRDGVEVEICIDGNVDGGVDGDVASYELEVVEGRDGVTRGWHSRYYGIREPCTSVALCFTGASVDFVTRFRLQ